MDIKDTLAINNARMSAESLLLKAKNMRLQGDKDHALKARSGNVHIKTKKDLIAAPKLRNHSHPHKNYRR